MNLYKITSNLRNRLIRWLKSLVYRFFDYKPIDDISKTLKNNNLYGKKFWRLKKFKCTYVKVEKILGPKQGPAQFIEQEIVTDQDGIVFVTPKGYVLVSIVEYLEPLNQCQNEKKCN
jgi:hypothetical protein